MVRRALLHSRGRLSFLVGDDIREGHEGDFVFAPRNTCHAFWVDSETAAFFMATRPPDLNSPWPKWRCEPPTRNPALGATPPSNITDEQYRRYKMENLPGPIPRIP